MQPDLFSRYASYPSVAGFKATETSAEAARTIDASTCRALVLAALRKFGAMTADECALRYLGYSILTVRPRFSELKALGQIEDSGQRRKNASGHKAIVWKVR